MDFDKVNKYMNILQDKYHPIMMFLYGSQNYSMDTETSDYDFNVIIKDDLKDFYELKYGKAKDVDFIVDNINIGKVNIIPLSVFLKGLRKGSITYYENFFSKASQFNDDANIFSYKTFKDKLIKTHYYDLLYSMIGYAYTYIEKYDKSKDPKVTANLLRVLYMIEYFILHKDLVFDMKVLEKDAFLKRVKQNLLSDKDKELVENKLQNVEEFLEEKKDYLKNSLDNVGTVQEKEEVNNELFELFIKLNKLRGEN